MMLEPIDRGVEIVTGGVDQAVALLGVRVESRITGLVERTTVTQSFRNDEAEAIEVTYTFPLPQDAAVCGFEVITGERVLTGKIKDRDEAVDEYDAAISAGDGAFMLESHRRDVFTVNVGNINPGQLAVLRVDYVRTLSLADQQLSLYYPTTVPPRYVTDTGSQNPVAVSADGEMVNPLRGAEVPYGLLLDVVIEGSLAVAGVESSSHTLVVLPEAGSDGRVSTRVVLADGQVEMDRDVVLDVSLKSSSTPASVVERLNDKHYAAVSFLPDFSALDIEAPAQSHVVFVVDCSGSMGGPSITQAKRALELCLRSLKSGDTFNLVRFGSNYEQFAPALVDYDDASLKRALKWVGATDANLGGTELMSPLQKVFTWTQPGEVVDVVVLTDGQVSNERAVLEMAESHAATHRVFSFGIGAAAGRNLCEGLASSTAGAAEFIGNDEGVETKVLRTFCRMASPRLDDVKLDGGEGVRLVLPKGQLPPLFDGDAVCLLAEVEGELPAGGTQWSLSAKHENGPVQWQVPVGQPVSLESAAGSSIAVAWANERIRSMEKAVADYAGVQARRGKQNRNEVRVKKQILGLSVEFNVLCDHTAFVALEHRSIEERNDGQPAQREVPVLMPDGHGLVLENDIMHSKEWSMNFLRESYDAPVVSLSSLSDMPRMSRKKSKRYSAAASSPSAAAPESNDELYDLLKTQQSNGAFAGIQVLGPDYSGLVENLLKAGAIDLSGFDAKATSAITDTLIVLNRLHSEFADQRSIWKRAADKAQAYLVGLGLDEASLTKAVTAVDYATAVAGK